MTQEIHRSERREAERRIDVKSAAEWKNPERRLGGDRRGERRCPVLPQGLHLIDLPQSMPGFREFISAWYFVDTLGRRIVVDPGPASTIPFLLNKLSDLTDGVDLVLLTHIHLDHSGGLGQFCRAYKGAKVIAHPKAARHLIDPAKLWSASLETLGDIARMYGAPEGVAETVLKNEKLPGIEVWETPGHAPHHISFRLSLGSEKLLFIGEAAGMTLPLGSGPVLPYLRPTTPPKFDARSALASLELLAECIKGDELLCYSHWGIAREAQKRIALAKGQIKEWLSVIAQAGPVPPEVIVRELLNYDPLLAGYSQLPEDLQQRERQFLSNSVKGFLDFLKNN